MIFCTHCGTELKENAAQCHECGQARAQKQQTSLARTGKNGPTKKQKMAVGGILAAVITIGGLYYTGSKLADGSKSLDSFHTALQERDSDTLLTHMVSADPVAEITEQHANDLLNYYHNDTYTANEIDDYLANRSEWIQRGASSAMADENDFGVSWFSFERTGSQWLFFDKYEAVINSIPLYASTNQTDVTFMIDGKEVQYEDEGEGHYFLGNHLPGIYDITAKLEADFVELEVSAEKNHYNEQAADLWFDVSSIELTSSVDGAALLIDGQETGITLGFEPTVIEPVLTDGSMEFQIEKETPFGTVSSPVYPAYDWFMDLYVEADGEILEQAISDLQSSFEKEGYNSISLHSYDIEILEKMDFYTDYTDLFLNGSAWELFIPVTEHWQVDTSWHSDDTDMNPYQDNREYHLIYSASNEKWVLNSTSYSYSTFDGTVETVYFDHDDQLDSILAEQETDSLAEYEENAEYYLETMFNSFISANVELINYGDDNVLTYIDNDADDYKDIVLDYADYLEGRNITQSFRGAELLSFNTSDDEYYEVTTYEDYVIYYGDDDEVKRKTFESVYDVRLTAEGFKVVELLKTDEQSSEDW